jgi:membrane protein
MASREGPVTGRIIRRLGRAVALTYEENGFAIGKGAAFSALLALFPVITTLASVLVRVRADSVTDALSRMMLRVVPPGSEGLVLHAFAERGERPPEILLLAGVVTLWGASGVMLSLMEGFDRIYGVASRSFLSQRAMAALLVLAGVVPVVAATALILFGRRGEQLLLRALGFVPPGAGLLVRYGVAVACILLVTCLLYRLGPNRRQRFANVWRGAVVAMILWLASTIAFGWYVRNIANYNVLYGSIGAVIALVVWMYVLSVIALYGCAFNAVWERSRLRR